MELKLLSMMKSKFESLFTLSTLYKMVEAWPPSSSLPPPPYSLPLTPYPYPPSTLLFQAVDLSMY